LQAAKRTPVDLQEWAISMMERHNRKSYLAPPAPKSLREGTTPTSNNPSSAAAATPVPPPISKGTPITSKPLPLRQQAPSPYQRNPPSDEIPMNVASDVSASHRHYGPASTQNHHYSSSRSARSPPPPSLELLSLETKDDNDPRSGRMQSRFLGDPVSAVEAPSRPFMSPRSVSSHNTKSRTNLNPATMPIRSLPPPSGPPPPPPVSAGGSRRGYPGHMPGTSS
jgi:mitogen-activated protein kinase kinase